MLFGGFGHFSDFIVLLPADRNGGDHGPDLIFSFAFRLLKEVPKRIHQNVIDGYASIFARSPHFTDPANSCPILGGEADGSPVSIIRNVFFSRTHFELCLTALLHCYIITL